jgi:hypothetical protein
MKHGTLALVVLLCSVEFAYSQSDTLHLYAESGSHWISSLNTQNPAHVIVLENIDYNANWKKIVRKLNAQDSLHSLLLLNCDIAQLPKALGNIKVKALNVFGSSLVPDADLFQFVSAMPNVETVRLETEGEPDYSSIKLQNTNIEKIELFDDRFIQEWDYQNLDFYTFKADQKRTELNVNDGAINERSIVMSYFTVFDRDEITTTIGTPEFTTEPTGEEQKDKTQEAAPVLFEKKYKSIVAPCEKHQVAKTMVTIDPAQSNDFVYEKSGTKVQIPANCFVDANGNEVKEPVTIQYREFRDPLEIALSGIPMTEKSNDSLYFFESAGMFDITADVNGQEVFIQNGKTIDINFKPVPTESQPNFYNFNDSTGMWTDLGKVDVPVKKNNFLPSNELMNAYFGYKNAFNSTYKFRDTTSLQDRFENLDYVNGRIRGRYIEDVKTEIDDHAYPITRSVLIRKVHTTRQQGVCFVLRTNTLVHKESRTFKNLYFSLDDSYSSYELRKTYTGRKNRFNDYRIVDEGGQLVIVLKSDSGFRELNVHCAQRTKVGSKTVYEEVPAPIDAYNNVLKKRTAKFDKRMRSNARLNKRESNRISKKTASKWARVQAIKDLEYPELSKANLITKLDSVNGNWRFSSATTNTLLNKTTNLSIPVLGVYNLDIKQSIPPSREVIAKFNNESDSLVSPEYVYLLIKGVNSAISFINTNDIVNSRKMLVPTENEFLIIVVDKKGQFYTHAATTGQMSSGSVSVQKFAVELIDPKGDRMQQLLSLWN